MMERGVVQHGGIVFGKPLALPEGTEVVVRIEPVVTEQESPVGTRQEGFADLAFFGMWADRSDMADGATWVRWEREQWRQRTSRED
jgi:hypothetical protein